MSLAARCPGMLFPAAGQSGGLNRSEKQKRQREYHDNPKPFILQR